MEAKIESKPVDESLPTPAPRRQRKGSIRKSAEDHKGGSVTRRESKKKSKRSTRGKKFAVLFQNDPMLAVIRLQRWLRHSRVRIRFIRLRRTTKIVQRWLRARVIRIRFLRTIHAAIEIQKAARGLLSRRKLQDMITSDQLVGEQLALHFAHERERSWLAMIMSVARGDASPVLSQPTDDSKLASPEFNTPTEVKPATTSQVNIKRDTSRTTLPKLLPFAVDTKMELESSYGMPWSEMYLKFVSDAWSTGASLKSIVMGGGFTAFLTDVGDVWTCGVGDKGQLGQRGVTSLKSARRIEPWQYQGTSTRNLNSKSSSVLLSTPKRSHFIVKFSAGESHVVVLDEIGQCYAFGNNNKGQLGYRTGPTSSSTGSFCSYPQIVPLSAAVQDVACGDSHSCAILNGGAIVWWGVGMFASLSEHDLNTMLTRTGDEISTNCNQTIARLHVLQDQTVNDWSIRSAGTNATALSVFCGRDFSVALCSDWQLYSWGMNTHGQLGQGSSIISLFKPTRVDFSVDRTLRVTKAAVGSSHVILVSSDGCLFGWGSNSNGQLGNGSRVNSFAPISLANLGGRRVLHIAAGLRHSVVILDGGDVFGMGRMGSVQSDVSFVPTVYNEAKLENVFEFTSPEFISTPPSLTRSIRSVKCLSSRSTCVSCFELADLVRLEAVGAVETKKINDDVVVDNTKKQEWNRLYSKPTRTSSSNNKKLSSDKKFLDTRQLDKCLIEENDSPLFTSSITRSHHNTATTNNVNNASTLLNSSSSPTRSNYTAKMQAQIVSRQRNAIINNTTSNVPFKVLRGTDGIHAMLEGRYLDDDNDELLHDEDELVMQIMTPPPAVTSSNLNFTATPNLTTSSSSSSGVKPTSKSSSKAPSDHHQRAKTSITTAVTPPTASKSSDAGRIEAELMSELNLARNAQTEAESSKKPKSVYKTKAKVVGDGQVLMSPPKSSSSSAGRPSSATTPVMDFDDDDDEAVPPPPSKKSPGSKVSKSPLQQLERQPEKKSRAGSLSISSLSQLGVLMSHSPATSATGQRLSLQPVK